MGLLHILRIRPYTPPMANFYEAAYTLVRKIPRGRVMSYGQVAAVLGQPRAARAVGYAMMHSTGVEPAVPWQRVVNRYGGISTGGETDRPERQRALLEAEGVAFRADGTIDMTRYGWEPPDPDAFLYEGRGDLPY